MDAEDRPAEHRRKGVDTESKNEETKMSKKLFLKRVCKSHTEAFRHPSENPRKRSVRSKMMRPWHC
eukprot:936880-Ditylum_brightwellii.AAC.1